MATTLGLQLLLGVLPALEIVLLAAIVNHVAGQGADQPPTELIISLAAVVAGRHLADHAVSALHPNTSVMPLVLRFVFRLIGRAEPRRFDDPDFLDLVQRAGGGVASHATTTLIAGGESVRALSGSLAMIGLIASLDLRLAALATLAAVPVLVVARLDGADSARAWSGDTVESRLRGYLGSLIRDPSASGEMRALGLADHLLQRLETLFANRVAMLRDLARRSRNRGIRVAAVQATVTVIALAVVVGDALDGRRPPGDVVTGLAAVAALSGLLTRMAEVLGYLTTAAPYLSPAQELERELAPSPTRLGPGIVTGGPLALRLRDVSFCYSGAAGEVIRGISLDVEPGELVALVGANGAGKSTLTRVALGVLPAQHGSVRLGEVDIARADLDLVWQRVGFLPQYPLRPEVPLREAVALGVPWCEPDDAAIIKALHAAGGGELLDKVGLDGILGRAWENGHDLSGGEWQRVALARLAYRRPDLWVLDEPTSNLDPSAEAAFVADLRPLLGEATCVFISHRFSTVRGADRIAVLEHGALTEVGDHAELMALGGTYARLFELQAAGYR